MVGALADVSGWSLAKSYRVFLVTLLALANTITFFLFRKASGSDKTAWAYTFGGALFFIALQDRKDLHVWDYVDLCVMSLFAWAVFRGAPLWSLILLFYVELLNREAALFIALWIALDAINLSGRDRQHRNFQIKGKKILLGAFLLVAGIAWTQFMRDIFFVRQTANLSSKLTYIGDQFWMFPHTLTMLEHTRVLDVLVPLAVLGTTLFLMLRAWSTLGERSWKIGVLISAFVTSNLMMGVLTETRIWLMLIPFWLWLIYTIHNDEHAPAMPERVHSSK